jgi:hypothetical protein
MITTEEAVAIALRHGLTPNDAAGIKQMATTAEEAEAIATQFSPNRQLTGAELKTMSAAEIVKAHSDGRLRDVLSGTEQ